MDRFGLIRKNYLVTISHNCLFVYLFVYFFFFKFLQQPGTIAKDLYMILLGIQKHVRVYIFFINTYKGFGGWGFEEKKISWNAPCIYMYICTYPIHMIYFINLGIIITGEKGGFLVTISWYCCCCCYYCVKESIKP